MNKVIKLWTKLFIIACCLLVLNQTALSQSLKTLQERTFNVTEGQFVKLETDAGDVKVNTWDNDQVLVKISGNRKAEDKFEFNFDQTSEGIYITAEREGSSWFNWWSGVDLIFEIKVPRKFEAFIYTAGGDIGLIDLTGNADLKTSGGDIDVYTCKGDYTLKTSGGDIDVQHVEGELYMSTSGGDIFTKKVTGNAEAKTSGGDISMEVSNGRVYASTSGGDIGVKLAGQNKGVILKTSGGDILLFVENDFTADLYLKTSGGDVDVDMPNTRTISVSSSKFEGQLNGGGAKVECRTTGGDIRVCRQ